MSIVNWMTALCLLKKVICAVIRWLARPNLHREGADRRRWFMHFHLHSLIPSLSYDISPKGRERPLHPKRINLYITLFQTITTKTPLKLTAMSKGREAISQSP